jgi:hypothetical protein
MRSNSARFIYNNVMRQIVGSQELRDAVIISVQQDDRYCEVKIQGSDKSIKAYYPENWEATPSYLKEGNAVRINMPGGNRSKIEVMGVGMLLPTAVPGGSVAPTDRTPSDAVLSGCGLKAASPAGLAMTVMAGPFRINGSIYTIAPVYMDDTSIQMDRADFLMDDGSASVTLDVGASGAFRIDAVVVGIDGIPHVVKGTNASISPEIPTTPADHVQLGTVLVPPDATAIMQHYVGASWSARTPTSMLVEVDGETLEWTDNSASISISVRDQYGEVYSGPWQLSVSLTNGTGFISGGGVSDARSLDYGFSGSTNITYSRDADKKALELECSPTIIIRENIKGYATAIVIYLLDVNGWQLWNDATWNI